MLRLLADLGPPLLTAMSVSLMDMTFLVLAETEFLLPNVFGKFSTTRAYPWQTEEAGDMPIPRNVNKQFQLCNITA